MTWTRRAGCRLCGQGLEQVLDYGPVALANDLRPPGQGGPRVPLTLCRCQGCGLVQVPEVVDPALLFGDYRYATGHSRTMVAHLDGLAQALASAHPGGRVLEIASNDGTLLAALAAAGLRPLGVEPAPSLAAEANARGLPTRAAFFDEALADRLRGEEGSFQAVVATNVLAHVDDPVGLLRGAARLLAPGGQVVVEVPSLDALLRAGAFDTVYHEHLCVFDPASLRAAFEQAGLGLARVEEIPVHGGSLRVTATRGPHAPEALAAVGAPRGRISSARLAALAAAAHRVRQELPARIATLRDRGLRVAAYGAAAKGAVLLQWCGVEDLPWVADANPRKQGLWLPGTRTVVVPPERVAQERPDVVLLLAWNLLAEVREQLRGQVGRLLVPLPRPRLLRP
ncbi:class I SAM-dependent methyltransferase [Myxococcota bacterium]|nr:class I SAM-dependent methyltransferase [Myxococcota bacterium]